VFLAIDNCQYTNFTQIRRKQPNREPRAMHKFSTACEIAMTGPGMLQKRFETRIIECSEIDTLGRCPTTEMMYGTNVILDCRICVTPDLERLDKTFQKRRRWT